MDILSVRNQPQKLTKISSDKKRKSPYNTIAATNCEGNPPLEIDKVKEKEQWQATIIRLTYPKQRKP